MPKDAVWEDTASYRFSRKLWGLRQSCSIDGQAA